VMGILAALLQARSSGAGQVIDVAIVDGVSHLLTAIDTMFNSGLWADRRGVNPLDGAAPFYRMYETSDGRYMAVGAIEQPFWEALLERLGLDDDSLPGRLDPSAWPAIGEVLAAVFRTRTQREWTDVFEGSDACTTPVVSMVEAAEHPQIKSRGSLRYDGGLLQSAVAPRFSEASSAGVATVAPTGAHTVEVLRSAGIDADALLASGAAHQA